MLGRIPDDKIVDFIDGKLRNKTPEEYSAVGRLGKIAFKVLIYIDSSR